ncbi:hypothetical protein, partial [Yersinia enterocolitica]|uniref:hypothetical protein n=1 Tax=Yersinia enterocolitica TaxID=630 RepID=UPI0009B2928A
YFQEKTLGLLGASIYGAGRAIRDDFTASLRSTCFHRCGHFGGSRYYDPNGTIPLQLILSAVCKHLNAALVLIIELFSRFLPLLPPLPAPK